MPLVSEVTHQKKNKERLNVFLDGKFAFSISLENLVKNKISQGKTIPIHKVKKIIEEERKQSLFDRGVNFLSFRPRSEKETRDYLAKKIAIDNSISYLQAKRSSQIDGTIYKLKKMKFLNDIEFAKWWVEARSTANIKGINVLKMELAAKGVERKIIDRVLEHIPNQQILAAKVVARKLKFWQKLKPFERKKKIYSLLSSRGFDYETTQTVLDKLEKKR